MRFIPKCFDGYHDSVEELLQDLLTISYDDSQKRDTESKDEEQDSGDDDFNDKIGFPFENFTPGVFIFKINNKEKKDLPLWRIENRNTVQRYIPFEKEGKTLYRSSAIYEHCFFLNRDDYLGVRVAFILQSKEETIVEIINDDAVSISAPSLAPQTSMACSALSTETKLESEFPTVKKDCINKNAPDDDLRLKIEEDNKQRENLTSMCTPTFSHIVTDDISIQDNVSFGRNLRTKQEKLINYACNCLKLANRPNYARVDYTEDGVSVPMMDLNSEILIDELVVESELCVANTSCHNNGLSNELAVIYPPIVIMKPCAIMREMDKVLNDTCDIKLQDMNLLKVLSKSKYKHKTAKICEISSHNFIYLFIQTRVRYNKLQFVTIIHSLHYTVNT